jgi:hypothetical protein
MTVPTDSNAHAAYQKSLPEAQALASADILPYRLDPDLVIINIQTAMPILTEHRAEISKHLPKIDLPALSALPALALALKFSAMEADKTVPSEKLVSQALVEARQIRSTLLPVVAGLAATGLVPQTEYNAIVRGRGPRDTASDCVAICHVFDKYKKAVKDKHSADPTMIKRAGEVGAFLLQHLRPAHAPAEKAPPPPPAVEIRNRFATLLVKRYSLLQVVAHYFEGDDYERVAPPLMSRQASRASKNTPSPDVPAGAEDAPAGA